LLAGVTLLTACARGDVSTGPGSSQDALALAPHFALIPSAADRSAAPIERIRLEVTSVSDGAAHASRTLDVSPTADSWTTTLSVPVAGGELDAVLYAYLLHVDGEGMEAVQFSGRSEPFTLRRNAVLSPQLDIVRGPPANLDATSVSITSRPASLSVGDTVTLAAAATTSGADAPTVFWTSLDTTVVTLSGSRATAVALGTAAVVASAGAFADTLVLLVAPRDGTPPEVVATLPAGGATGVNTGTHVSVTLDGPLDPASVTASSLGLRTAAGVPVAGSVTYANSTIVFDPTAALDTLTTYTATLAPGIRDQAGNVRTASFQWTFTTSAQRLSVASSFNAALGVLVAVAFDPASGNLFLYDDFAAGILEYTPSGTLVTPAVPNPGTASNDYDLDFLPESVNLGGTTVGANSLLVMNGEDLPLRRVYALNKDTGAILAQTTIPMSDPVGLSYHPGRDTFFGIDWTRDVVEELNPATGAVLASFPVAPVGAPAWDTYYGDIEVDQASGRLILVSSAQPIIRIMSTTGIFIADVDVAPLGVANMSGIAWDDANATAWISTTSGDVYRLVGLAP
jgi:hypothetical protein